MYPSSGIMEIDIHGFTCVQAQLLLDSKLRTVKKDTYRIRVIHGYNRGTELRSMIRLVYSKNPKVLRLELGLNPGETDLVLREL